MLLGSRGHCPWPTLPSLNPFLVENFPSAGKFLRVEAATDVASARPIKYPGVHMIFLRAFVRRRVISLAASLSVSATSLALAQAPGNPHHLHAATSDRNERQFLFVRDLAVSDVSRASLAEPTGNGDRDFVAMMIPQNQTIIDMARAELLYGHNDELRHLAGTIVAQQQQQISMMNGAVGSAASTQTAEAPPPSAALRSDSFNRAFEFLVIASANHAGSRSRIAT